jgi:murein DD-endopeptidase MepM/ murein hydrolase activator NlpD
VSAIARPNGSGSRAAFRAALALWAGVTASATIPPPGWAAEIPLIDAHSQLDQGVRTDLVISLMDEAGVSRTILSSLRSLRRTRDVVDLARAHPDRITASVGMKVKSLFEGAPEGFEFLRRVVTMPIFGAMSEAMILHAQKGNKAPYIAVDIDAPQMREALAVAMKRTWPFEIHIEFAYARSTRQYSARMQALERLLRAHPGHPMALTHMGQLSSTEAARLIGAHRNIHFLTSHANTVFIDGRAGTQSLWTDLFAGRAIARDWKSLMLAHPDRFVFALDNVYADDWGNAYLRQVRLWKAALADLPAEVAHAVAHRNAERLWNLPPLSGPTAVTQQHSAAARPTATGSASGLTTLSGGAASMVAGLIGSDFGADTNIDGRSRGGQRHNAVDIKGRTGDEVLAAANGRVTFAGETPRGLAVVIAHGQDTDGSWYLTRYLHNAENLVSVGETVRRGQVIARLGNTGTRGSAPHVHFQVDKSATPRPARDNPNASQNPHHHWHAEPCFDTRRAYDSRPIQFTLPVRCAP